MRWHHPEGAFEVDRLVIAHADFFADDIIACRVVL